MNAAGSVHDLGRMLEAYKSEKFTPVFELYFCYGPTDLPCAAGTDEQVRKLAQELIEDRAQMRAADQ